MASIPIFDRSRDRLRLPQEILPEALRQAGGEGLASPIAAVRLETGRILVDGELDPGAAELLRVIARASLIVAIDVRRAGDSSVTTIWATPHHAVVSTSVDPHEIDIEPVRMSRMADRMADTILLGRPTLVTRPPISVPTKTMADADRRRHDPDEVRRILRRAGVEPNDIEPLVAFGEPTTRWWRITSTWATPRGPLTADIRGLDAADHGQWLIEMTGDRDGDGALTFTPQGDGEVLSALRRVLPKSWVGTPLNRPAQPA